MSSGDMKIANLRQGHPAKECLIGCSKMVLEASQEVLRNPALEQDVFQYGDHKGPKQFCDELAKFLTEEYQDTVLSENLLVSCGATQGLHLVASALFTKDNPVFLEELSYYHSIRLFRDMMQMKSVSVPMDQDGIKPEVFDKMLTEERKLHSHIEITESRPYWAMAYLIPTFQNPTGICYSPSRCRELIHLARKHKILLVCDDVYNLLYYGDLDKSPPRLLSYDNVKDSDYMGSVVSIGTFTKIFAPGLRLGWVEALPRVMNQLNTHGILLRSGGCLNQCMAYIMAAALKQGLVTENVKRLRKLYHRRMNLLLKGLREFLPDSCSINTQSKGGYFVWMTLPEWLDAEVFQKLTVAQYKVDFMPGIRCSTEQKFHNCVRLSMSSCDEDLIASGVQRLCQAIRESAPSNMT